MPVYNTEKYLEKCLNSLLEQTYTCYEIICVNDCSPDNSGAILAKYRQRYPNVITVLTNESNMGLGLTRQRGIEESSGQYLIFIDSDDYVEKDYIQRYIQVAESTNADIVIGGYTRDIGDKRIANYPPDSIWASISLGSACAKLYKKTFVTDNHIAFSASRCSEDVFFTLCTFYSEADCATIKYAGYHYVMNSSSITADKDYDKNLEELTNNVFDEFLQTHDIKRLSKEKRDMIEYDYIATMLNTLLVFNRGCGIKRMKAKYSFFTLNLNKHFPTWRQNPYIGFFRPSGQTGKIRIAVGVCMTAYKLKLLKPLLYVFSLL